MNGWKSPFSVFNMTYFSALSIFIFKIGPFKSCSHMVYKWVLDFQNTKKIWFFSPNTKNFYRFDHKVGRKLSQVMWFECFKILTHQNYLICMYRWEGWWNCLTMLWYFKILEDCNTFIIFETLKQNVTLMDLVAQCSPHAKSHSTQDFF